jgi:two-component system, LytTR family, sensor kinase
VRRTEKQRPKLWARIQIVLTRDELGFPSFWQLQLTGSVGLYLLVLLSVLPDRNPGEFRHQTIFCATVFVVSCFLRPVCRSLLRRSLPWLSLEIRAFGWSAAYGAVATFLSELLKLRAVRPIWVNFLDNWLPFSVVFFLWCTLYFSTKHWQQSAHERTRLVRAESEAREARLSALRYQLNPHFLFNSLNAVSTLVLEGNVLAATRMLAQIGELLRTTLDNDASPEIPLSQELAFVEQYLAIEQTRLGGRLRVFKAISPDTLDAVVPSMLLQPLVENAVRHGVAPLIQGGTLAIEITIQNDCLVMTIRNSGPQVNPTSTQAVKPSKGIGLTNTAERLRTLYGDKQSFSLRSPGTGGYEVTIELPFRRTAPSVEGGVCAL